MKGILFVLGMFSAVQLSAGPLLSFNGDDLGFKYPESFKVSEQVDNEGIKEIFIEGPNRTSIFVTIFPGRMELDLDELADTMHGQLESNYKDLDFSVRDRTKQSKNIGDKLVAGVNDTYTFKRLFSESKMSYSYYLVIGTESTYLIAEEFQVKYMKESIGLVNIILGSMEFKK